MLVEEEGPVPSWDENRNCPMGLACPDPVGATQFPRLGHDVPYLQTDLETGFCFYRAWLKSLLMGAWTLGSSPRERVPLALLFTSSDWHCMGLQCSTALKFWEKLCYGVEKANSAGKQEIFNQIRFLRASFSRNLNVSRGGASTTFLGNLFQCFITLLVKNFSLIAKLNLPTFNLKP